MPTRAKTIIFKTLQQFLCLAIAMLAPVPTQIHLTYLLLFVLRHCVCSVGGNTTIGVGCCCCPCRRRRHRLPVEVNAAVKSVCFDSSSSASVSVRHLSAAGRQLATYVCHTLASAARCIERVAKNDDVLAPWDYTIGRDG
jgi:hypothetical protein